MLCNKNLFIFMIIMLMTLSVISLGVAQGDIEPESFSAYIQNGDVVIQSAMISNSDSADSTMFWQLTDWGVDWLECDPASGYLEPGEETEVAFIFSPEDEDVGNHESLVYFSWEIGEMNGGIDIPCTMEIYDVQIEHQPPFITVYIGGEEELPDTSMLYISNIGSGELEVNLTTIVQDSTDDWLSVYPNSATIDAGTQDSFFVVSDEFETIGYGVVQIQHNDYDYNDGQPIDVPVTVTGIPGEAGGVAWPDSFDVMMNNDAEHVELYWVGNETEATAMMNWELAIEPEVDWLTADPTEGYALINGESECIVLTFDTENMDVGDYFTTLNLHWWEISGEGDEGTIQTPVSLTVNDPEIETEPETIEFYISGYDSASAPLIISNTGTGVLDCEIEVNTAGEVSGKPANARSTSELRRRSKSGRQRSDLSESRSMKPLAQPLNPGDILSEWDTGLDHPWGVGYELGYVWFSDFDANAIYQYDAESGELAGESIINEASSWWADMAYDRNHDGFWVVEVGGENALKLIDPDTGEILDSISGDWDFASARGVAYDPISDYLWVGGINHDDLYCVKGIDHSTPGETVRTIWSPDDATGLAWSCEDETIWVTTSSEFDYIYELNPFTGEMLTLYELVPGFVGYCGAGCEMNENGDLWVANQQTGETYLIETHVGGGCYREWLWAEPTQLSVNPGESDTVMVYVDISEEGDYWGSIEIYHNDSDVESPYAVPVVVIPGNPSFHLDIADEIDFGDLDWMPEATTISDTTVLVNMGQMGGNWTATWNSSWITVEPDSGYLEAYESVELNVSVTYGGDMECGSYEDNIVIQGSDSGEIQTPVYFMYWEDCTFPPHIYGEWDGDESIHLWWDFDWNQREDVEGFLMYRRGNDGDYETPIAVLNDPEQWEWWDQDIPAADSLHYSMKAIYEESGLTGFGNEITFYPDIGAFDGAMTYIPNEFRLNQNYPNPFNPKTTISVSIPITSYVELTVYDVAGQLIRRLVNRELDAGNYRFEWNGDDDSGKNVSSGIYFVKLTWEEESAIRKMILLK